MAAPLSLGPVAAPRTFWRHWRRTLSDGLQRWQRRRAERRAAELAQRSREACAEEGADLEFGVVEIDGRRFGALYRSGQLVGLLPELDRL
ncbi:MAG: hypothetical protein L6Q75_04565 [Burkholderiaceae bacterium]|nr:hypothetical protein [Burkholderiaceae bacterium]